MHMCPPRPQPREGVPSTAQPLPEGHHEGVPSEVTTPPPNRLISDPRSPDFFHLISSAIKLGVTGKPSTLCSDSWVVICHPDLLSPVYRFSSEKLPCSWPGTSSQIPHCQGPCVSLARCMYPLHDYYQTVACFPPLVSLALMNKFFRLFGVNPHYKRLCIWEWEATNRKPSACGKDHVHSPRNVRQMSVFYSKLKCKCISSLFYLNHLLRLSEIIGMLMDFLAGIPLLLWNNLGC